MIAKKKVNASWSCDARSNGQEGALAPLSTLESPC